MQVEFVSKLNDLLIVNQLTYQELHRKTGLNYMTVRKLAKKDFIDRIDRRTTQILINFFNCSFEDLWEIKISPNA